MTSFAVLWAGCGVVPVPGNRISADEALAMLMAGNRRFVSGDLAPKDMGDGKRTELAKGQSPLAVVLTCSDSRVPPELLFDQGLGDVFVVRVAGNVVGPVELGSIEYAAEHLHTPLLFILGHSQCGAVKATFETKGRAEGNVGEIIRKIGPAVETALKKGGTEEVVLQEAVRENVRNVCRHIVRHSTIVRHLVDEGKMKIVGGEYELSSGTVQMIELPLMEK